MTRFQTYKFIIFDRYCRLEYFEESSKFPDCISLKIRVNNSTTKLAYSDAEDKSDMYSTSSGQRRGLLRPHSSHSGPVFRNLPLFGFLAGLVFFFYLLYIYQAQNAELVLAQEKSQLQSLDMDKLRDQITDSKAQLEKQKTEFEASLESVKKEKSSLEEQLKTCSSNQENQKNEITRLEGEKNDYLSKLEAMKIEMQQLKDAQLSIRYLNQTYEQTIKLLNEKVSALEEKLKKSQLSSNLSAAGMNALKNDTINVKAALESVIQQDNRDQKPAVIPNNNLLKNVETTQHQGKVHLGNILLPKNSEDHGEANVQKQNEANVIAAPNFANEDEKKGDKLNEGRVEQNNAAEGGGEKKALDDADDVKVIPGKDYRNSAEDEKLQAQENKLKPNEDVLEGDNDDKQN